MEISFEKARLQKLCNSGKLKGKYGPHGKD